MYIRVLYKYKMISINYNYYSLLKLSNILVDIITENKQ